MNRKKAVVIGCGKIGALYDFDNENLLLSHAKGYFISKLTDLVGVVDMNEEIARKVAGKYSCDFASDYTSRTYDDIDVISICVPTETHFKVLQHLHSVGYRNLIILEKPVVSNANEIEKLLTFGKDFLDQIYINYIRRYDIDYIDVINDLRCGEYGDIKHISVGYFGEFEHNAIHAINILNYIFETKPSVNYMTDAICLLSYAGKIVDLKKLETGYINYDIIFFTEEYKIVFDHLGYFLSVYQASQSNKFSSMKEVSLKYEKSVLNAYVLNMIDMVLSKSKNIPTIFEGIHDMKIIQEIKNVSNYSS